MQPLKLGEIAGKLTDEDMQEWISTINDQQTQLSCAHDTSNVHAAEIVSFAKREAAKSGLDISEFLPIGTEITQKYNSSFAVTELRICIYYEIAKNAHAKIKNKIIELNTKYKELNNNPNLKLEIIRHINSIIGEIRTARQVSKWSLQNLEKEMSNTQLSAAFVEFLEKSYGNTKQTLLDCEHETMVICNAVIVSSIQKYQEQMQEKIMELQPKISRLNVFAKELLECSTDKGVVYLASFYKSAANMAAAALHGADSLEIFRQEIFQELEEMQRLQLLNDDCIDWRSKFTMPLVISPVIRALLQYKDFLLDAKARYVEQIPALFLQALRNIFTGNRNSTVSSKEFYDLEILSQIASIIKSNLAQETSALLQIEQQLNQNLLQGMNDTHFECMDRLTIDLEQQSKAATWLLRIIKNKIPEIEVLVQVVNYEPQSESIMFFNAAQNVHYLELCHQKKNSAIVYRRILEIITNIGIKEIILLSMALKCSDIADLELEKKRKVIAECDILSLRLLNMIQECTTDSAILQASAALRDDFTKHYMTLENMIPEKTLEALSICLPFLDVRSLIAVNRICRGLHEDENRHVKACLSEQHIWNNMMREEFGLDPKIFIDVQTMCKYFTLLNRVMQKECLVFLRSKPESAESEIQQILSEWEKFFKQFLLEMFASDSQSKDLNYLNIISFDIHGVLFVCNEFLGVYFRQKCDVMPQTSSSEIYNFFVWAVENHASRIICCDLGQLWEKISLDGNVKVQFDALIELLKKCPNLKRVGINDALLTPERSDKIADFNSQPEIAPTTCGCYFTGQGREGTLHVVDFGRTVLRRISSEHAVSIVSSCKISFSEQDIWSYVEEFFTANTKEWREKIKQYFSEIKKESNDWFLVLIFFWLNGCFDSYVYEEVDSNDKCCVEDLARLILEIEYPDTRKNLNNLLVTFRALIAGSHFNSSVNFLAYISEGYKKGSLEWLELRKVTENFLLNILADDKCKSFDYQLFLYIEAVNKYEQCGLISSFAKQNSTENVIKIYQKYVTSCIHYADGISEQDTQLEQNAKLLSSEYLYLWEETQSFVLLLMDKDNCNLLKIANEDGKKIYNYIYICVTQGSAVPEAKWKQRLQILRKNLCGSDGIDNAARTRASSMLLEANNMFYEKNYQKCYEICNQLISEFVIVNAMPGEPYNCAIKNVVVSLLLNHPENTLEVEQIVSLGFALLILMSNNLGMLSQVYEHIFSKIEIPKNSEFIQKWQSVLNDFFVDLTKMPLIHDLKTEILVGAGGILCILAPLFVHNSRYGIKQFKEEYKLLLYLLAYYKKYGGYYQETIDAGSKFLEIVKQDEQSQARSKHGLFDKNRYADDKMKVLVQIAKAASDLGDEDFANKRFTEAYGHYRFAIDKYLEAASVLGTYNHYREALEELVRKTTMLVNDHNVVSYDGAEYREPPLKRQCKAGNS